MSLDKLNELRWKALEGNHVLYSYIKKHLKDKYNIEVKGVDWNEFIRRLYEQDFDTNEQEILFDLEDSAYRKASLFIINESALDELNDILRGEFISRNRLENIIENKKINSSLDEILYPCYIKFSERYITIKIAQLRKYTTTAADENYATYEVEHIDYHCAKFVIDLYYKIVALFYNDINNEGEGSKKGKAITEKKQLFYNLFQKGNQGTLMKLNLDIYLIRYIKKYLGDLNDITDNEDKTVLVIETSDPVEHKNNLRSSKKDGRHNKYRLQAIKYALEHEEHTITVIECNIESRWFQFKNQGEIISNVPYFGKEVIESVCKEIFPTYKIFTKQEEVIGS